MYAHIPLEGKRQIGAEERMLCLIFDELLLRSKGDPSEVLQRAQWKLDNAVKFTPVESVRR